MLAYAAAFQLRFDFAAPADMLSLFLAHVTVVTGAEDGDFSTFGKLPGLVAICHVRGPCGAVEGFATFDLGNCCRRLLLNTAVPDSAGGSVARLWCHDPRGWRTPQHVATVSGTCVACVRHRL